MSGNLIFKNFLQGFFKSEIAKIIISRTVLRICYRLFLEYFGIKEEAEARFTQVKKFEKVKIGFLRPKNGV